MNDVNETSSADGVYLTIGELVSDTEIISVSPDDTFSRAATLMMSHDFSQIPVMEGDRKLVGVVSWKSIGYRVALGKELGAVRSLMEKVREIAATASLFDAIPIIVTHGYVIVRNVDRTVKGIVTSSDLSYRFHQLTEPFLLIGEIESIIRSMISGKFTAEDLMKTAHPLSKPDQSLTVDSMTFGQYVMLLENPERWKKLGLAIDRIEFIRQMGEVRKIRNKVMHFRPEGLDDSDLAVVRAFRKLLRRIAYVERVADT